jgi:hypothetical protein
LGFVSWALYHAMHLEDVMVNFDESLLKGIIDLGVEYGGAFSYLFMQIKSFQYILWSILEFT